MYGDTWAVRLNTLKPSYTVWHSYHLPKRMSNAFLALFLYVSVINHFLWFWIERLCKIYLCQESVFLCYTLVIFQIIRSLILLSMLKKLFFTILTRSRFEIVFFQFWCWKNVFFIQSLKYPWCFICQNVWACPSENYFSTCWNCLLLLIRLRLLHYL